MTKDEFWQTVLGEIELSLSKANFTTWFKNTSVYNLEGEKLIINVPNIFAKEWLERKYRKIILDSARKFHPELNKVICSIEGKNPIDSAINTAKSIDSVINLKSKDSPSLRKKVNPPKDNQKNINSTLNPRYCFDTFVVGSNNELAFAACKSIAENPGKNYNPLFIYGGVGLGKTHLLQSTGNSILDAFPRFKIRYVGMERFANELLDALQNSKAREFKNEYVKLDVLIIDDVQFLAKKEKTQEEFFHIFETLYQLGKQIILSSDRPPKSIPTLEDRLRSRFEGGMIADITKPDIETRTAIIRKKLQEKNFYLEDEIVQYLVENIYHNVRELEGALNKIIVTFQLKNTQPTLNEIVELINDLISTNREKNLEPKQIISSVADFFEVDKKEITSRSRKKKLIKPRQVAIYLMRKHTKMSFPEIGQTIGGRDHSTVIYACEKIEKEIKENNILQDHLKFIQEKFSDY
jgi:chromosomal replication initiator protein